MNIRAEDGKVVIADTKGEVRLEPKEAFNLASDLIEAAKRAKEQKEKKGGG